MVTVDINSEIGADGMLRIALPASFRNKKVKACISIDNEIVVDPKEAALRRKYTLKELAGAWKGEFEIPYEGDHDHREGLDDLPS